MNRNSFVATFVCFMILASGTQAQPDSSLDDVLLDWKDPRGDVSGNPPAAFAFTDLEGASLSMQGDAVMLRFNPASMEADWTRFTSVEYWVAVMYREDLFHLAVEFRGAEAPRTNPPGVGDWTTAYVWAAGESGWDRIATGVGGSSKSDGYVGASFGLQDIISGQTYPQPGEVLRVVGIQSFWHSSNQPWHVTGPGAGLVYEDLVVVESTDVITVPGQTTSEVTMVTPQPRRFSNGEATTFHWPVELISRSGGYLDLDLSAETSAEVQLRMPQTMVVAPGDVAEFDVYATVPFAHEHGGQRIVTLTASSEGVAARLSLIIEYVGIPQPAGHHNQLFLHGGTPGTSGATASIWMNTDDLHSPPGTMLAGRSGSCIDEAGDSQGGYAWTFHLNPGLLMGLDGEVDEAIELSMFARTNAPLPAGRIYANLEVADMNDRRELPGFVVTSAPGIELASDAGGNRHQIDINWPLPPKLDYVPLAPDTNLRLEILYCPVNDVPNQAFAASWYAGLSPLPPIVLESGGVLTLPLLEYRDALQFSDENQLGWIVDSVVREVTPGGVTYWDLQSNLADAVPALFGLSQEAAHIELIEAEKNGTRIVVSIEASKDAKPGEVLEIVLVADKDDVSGSAIRLTAHVRDDAGDERAQLDALLSGASKSVPGLPLGLAVAALAAFRIRRYSQ